MSIFSVNKLTILGRTGKDPDLLGSGVVAFSVALDDSYIDKSGTKIEKTEWVKCVAFGKIAELCGKYLHKGDKVYCEGKLQTRKWDDKDGNKRYSTEMVVLHVIFLESRRSESSDAPRQDDDADPPF